MGAGGETYPHVFCVMPDGIMPGMDSRIYRGARQAFDGRIPIGQAGDAVKARGLEGFGQRHRRQDGRQAAGQPRCACPWGPSQSR
jgi:hypothetical protein